MLNVTRATTVAARCRVADAFLSRGIGLLGRSRLADGEGLLITRTSTITMLGMRMPIDAVFLDREGRVVKVRPRLRPWSLAIGAPSAAGVLELAAGAASASGTQAGDVLVFEAL
ncbi:MAG: DUF192 domain-containing protein [Chloroflexota bacterium]|nr:DUF192 domain-containing protein [Chloroflexota bacterium]